MVAGIVKEIITITTAVAVFGDDFGWVNALGVVIAISGVVLFNLYKLRRIGEDDVHEVVLVKQPGGSSEGAGGGGSAGTGGGGADQAQDLLLGRRGSSGGGRRTRERKGNGNGSGERCLSGEEEEEEGERETAPLLPLVSGAGGSSSIASRRS